MTVVIIFCYSVMNTGGQGHDFVTPGRGWLSSNALNHQSNFKNWKIEKFWERKRKKVRKKNDFEKNDFENKTEEKRREGEKVGKEVEKENGIKEKRRKIKKENSNWKKMRRKIMKK